MTDVASAALDLAQNAILVPSTGYFLSLHTADPGQSGAAEGTDGRQAVTFASSSAGTQLSSNGQTWASAAGGQTYTYFGIWTLTSGGTFLRGGSLGSPITPPVASQITLASGGISLVAS